jgi:hypothetical protein
MTYSNYYHLPKAPPINTIVRLIFSPLNTINTNICGIKLLYEFRPLTAYWIKSKVLSNTYKNLSELSSSLAPVFKVDLPGMCG